MEQGAAGMDELDRQAVHLDVAAVADDDACIAVEHHEALRDVVERSGELPVPDGEFTQELPPAQQDDHGDGQDDRGGCCDQIAGRRLPFREHFVDGRGHDHRHGVVGKPSRSYQTVVAVDRTLQPGFVQFLG
jgi:hypothetical protein